MPSSMVPASTSKVSVAGRRSYHSSTESSSTSSPAASWRTTLPQAMVSTPGWRIIGTSSRGRPNPMMSKRTMGWL